VPEGSKGFERLMKGGSESEAARLLELKKEREIFLAGRSSPRCIVCELTLGTRGLTRRGPLPLHSDRSRGQLVAAASVDAGRYVDGRGDAQGQG
jgi:hypothetical protein